MRVPYRHLVPLCEIWLAALVCALIATPVCAAPFSLSAALVEDTYVHSGTPDIPYDGHEYEIYIRNYSAFGRVGLGQFTLPQLPAGYTAADILSVELSGVTAWLPAGSRVMSLELLGLAVNPDLATVTYTDLLDTSGNGVITGYDNYAFTYGSQATSLDAMTFTRGSDVVVGDTVAFPDEADGLLGFVQSNISGTGPTTITLAIGPGESAASACDFRFYAMENTAGTPMALTLTFVPEPSALLLAFVAIGVLLLGKRGRNVLGG